MRAAFIDFSPSHQLHRWLLARHQYSLAEAGAAITATLIAAPGRIVWGGGRCLGRTATLPLGWLLRWRGFGHHGFLRFNLVLHCRDGADVGGQCNRAVMAWDFVV